VPEVRYTAVADFSQLLAEIAVAQAALKSLRDDQNRARTGGAQAAGTNAAQDKQTQANLRRLQQEADAEERRARARQAATTRQAELDDRRERARILGESKLAEQEEKRQRAREMGESKLSEQAAQRTRAQQMGESKLAEHQEKRQRDEEAFEAKLADRAARRAERARSATLRDDEARARSTRNADMGDTRLWEARERRRRSSLLGDVRQGAAEDARNRNQVLGQERINRATQARMQAAHTAATAYERLQATQEARQRRTLLFEEQYRAVQERNARIRARAAESPAGRDAELRRVMDLRREEERLLQVRRRMEEGRHPGSFLTRMVREFREGFRVFDQGEERLTRLRRAVENSRRVFQESFLGRLISEFRDGYAVFDDGESRFTRLSRGFEKARRVMRDSFLGNMVSEFREGYRVFDEGESHTTRLTRGMGNVRRAMSQRITEGSGGLVGSLVRDFRFGYRQVEDFENRMTRFRRGVAMLMHGGGGTGGTTGGPLIGFFEGFSRAGNKAVNVLGNVSKSMLSWRGLIALLVASIGPLIAMIDALGAVILGLNNVMVTVAASTAALPGLFLALAAAVGAVMTAVMPLVNVFKLYSAAQKATTAGSREMAQAQADAADRTRNAQRSYRSASKALADALYQERQSQVNLNEARRDALRSLQDLRAEVARSGMDEKAATLSLARAQDDYRKALADPTASLLDREEALLRVQQAEWDLRDVQQKNIRDKEDLVVAERRGVEGSQQVVDAKRAQQDAILGVRDATERMADAAQDLAKAQAEEAAGGSAALKAQQALQDALDKLSPSARKFVLGLIDMKSAWTGIQKAVSEKLFSPLVGQLENLKSLVPTVSMLLEDAAGAMGDVAAKGIAMLASGPWKADFAKLSKNNAVLLTNMGDAALYVMDALKEIAVAAIPFTTWVSEGVRNIAKRFQEWAKAGRDSGSITKFLETTKDRLQQLGRIFGDIWHTLAGLSSASQEFTDWMLDGLERMTQRWSDNADAQNATGSGLKKWLEEVKPLLSSMHDFLGKLAQAFMDMGKDPKNMEEAKRILTVLSDKVLPALVKLFTSLSQNEAISKIFSAIASGLEAVNRFVNAGGGQALGIFASGLERVGEFWKFVLDNPVFATILSSAATAMALFVTSAAIAKLTGLTYLWTFLKFVLASKFPTSLLSRIFGVAPKITAAGQAEESARAASQLTVLEQIYAEAKLANVELGRLVTQGLKNVASVTYTAQLAQIIAILEVCCANMARMATAATVAAATGGLGGVVRGGVAARAAAPAGLAAGSRYALPAGSAAGRPGTIWVPSTAGSPIRTPPGAFPASRVIQGEVAAVGTATGAAQGAGLLTRVGTGLAKAANPLALIGLGFGMAADTGMFGGRGSKGKQAGQAGGAILGMAGTGALIGTMVGGPVGTVVGGVLGGAVGAGYSLYKDKGLRKTVSEIPGQIGNLASNVGDTLSKFFSRDFPRVVAGAFNSIKHWFTDTLPTWWSTRVVRPISDFFTKTLPKLPGSILHAISNLPKVIVAAIGFVAGYLVGRIVVIAKRIGGLWDAFYDNVLKPVGKWFSDLPGKVRDWWNSWTFAEIWNKFWDTCVKPVQQFFIDLPGNVAAWWNSWTFEGLWNKFWDTCVKPVQRFFTDLPGNVSEWWNSWTFQGVWDKFWVAVVAPVEGFFSGLWGKIVTWWDSWTFQGVWDKFFKQFIEPVENFFKGLPDKIKGWFGDMWDILVDWYHKGYNAATGKQSGGLIEGAGTGRVDNIPLMATAGEFMVRKRAVDKPGAKALLRDINEERIDPATLYAALDVVNKPGWYEGPKVPGRMYTFSNVTNTSSTSTTSRGINVGGVTINNPVAETSGRSLRNSLQTLLYLHNQ
jgi:hypothetical protein